MSIHHRPPAGQGRDHPDNALARLISNAHLGEQQRRGKLYGDPNAAEHRVCIHSLKDRRDLNGKYGMAGPVQPSGKRLVTIEGGGGASISLTMSNLELAAEQPVDAVYNAGAAAYQRRQYSNNGLPRRCRAGSGRPSYSTTKSMAAAAEPIEPPMAGSLLPRANAPTDFTEAFTDGSLPVRLADAVETGELRWIDPLSGAVVPRAQVDARRWLPLLISGLRDPKPSAAYIALRASLELVGTTARRGLLPPLMPVIAPSIKAAIDLRERSCVCAAVRLLILILQVEPRCGLALRPHFKVLLPVLAAFKLAGQPSLGDEVERSQHRQINIEDLVDEALEAMEKSGGPGAGELIKQYVTTWQPASVELHRGFR